MKIENMPHGNDLISYFLIEKSLVKKEKSVNIAKEKVLKSNYLQMLTIQTGQIWETKWQSLQRNRIITRFC